MHRNLIYPVVLCCFLFLATLMEPGTSYSAGVPQGHILDSNTVALWRLDEISASANAVDETGTYHLTQFGNPGVITAPIDNGRILDGTTQFFQRPGDAALGAALNGDWTYEGWVYLDPAFGNPSEFFVYNGLAFSFNQSDTILAEVGAWSDKKVFWHQWQSPTSFTEVRSSGSLQTGRYNHIAVSRTAQGGNLFTYRLYINGHIDTTTTGVAGLTSPVTGATHFIGLGNYTDISGFGVGGAKLNGRLEDTRISKIARSDTEVLDSFHRGSLPLTVAKTGLGTVNSQFTGIACGATCTAYFTRVDSVILTATPYPGFVFAGWSGGGCSGTGTCTVTLTDATTVNATFTPISNSAFSVIATGERHNIALRADGTLWGWGDNTFGQVGDGTTTQRNSAIQIGADTDWAAITAGTNHSLAIKTDGTLWAWGENAAGQLGDGGTTNRSVPFQVGTDSDWAVVSAGTAHSVAVKSNGTLWAWGDNSSGQLGDGGTTTRSTPALVGTDATWTAISAGGNHCLTKKIDGTLWAWGENNNGELGKGVITVQYSPLQIGTDTTWGSISAGRWHSLATKTVGTLWSWGYNGYGQLGRGADFTSYNVPTQAGTDTNWLSVSAYSSHTALLKTDGTLWTMGVNDTGQLGNGTTGEFEFAPIKIGADTDWGAVTVGAQHTIALKLDGSLWAWGGNGTGQLGDGTTTNTNAPESILVIAPTPVNGAQHVPGNSVISATFSAAMDGATIDASTFTLSNGSAVAGTVSYNAGTRTATFTPSANLSLNTVYTATITTGVKKATGTALPANYAWSFTNDTLPPTDGTLLAIPGRNQIILSWSGFSDPNGVASYKVVSSTLAIPPDCSGTSLYTGTVTTFTDTGLANDATKFYRVCATDNAGNVSSGAVAQATTFSASTLLWETFSLGILPTDWVASNSWIFSLSANPTSGTGGFATINNIVNTGLLTPHLNLSAMSTPTLEFKSVFTGSPGNADLTVNVSMDGGTTWNATPLLLTSTPYGAITSVYPLAAAISANPNDVVIRFNFRNNDSGSPSWAIDDVKVYDAGAAITNIAPLATSQTVKGLPAASVTVTLAGSYANGDPLTYAIISQPAHGVLSGTPPNMTYTPNAQFVGLDSFAFKVNAGAVDSQPALVNLRILPDGIIVSETGKTDPSIVDALRTLRFAVNLDTPTPQDRLHSDVAPLVNGIPSPNGIIDLGDAIVILRRAVGLVSW